MEVQNKVVLDRDIIHHVAEAAHVSEEELLKEAERLAAPHGGYSIMEALAWVWARERGLEDALDEAMDRGGSIVDRVWRTMAGIKRDLLRDAGK